ncbi:MAG: porphobilinogen synthase [Gemmataceae bacterium]|nr:porphobilinogen synthase [Gemmataceae bacterium]
MDYPGFPLSRPRRLRHHPLMRRLLKETRLDPADFVLPLFIRQGKGIRKEVSSMPGVFQLSPDTAVEEAGKAIAAGVKAFLLFGIPASKDATGSSALDPEGIVCQSLRALKKEFHDNCLLITDECFCEYTDHGHCGILSEKTGRLDLDGDATLPLLARQCVEHARAGADLVAPSGMLDGMVGAIRLGLDEAGFNHLPIMSYAVKFASGFYGPFREAAESPPQFGDRQSYQMDGGNAREALKEAALDIAQGADLVMVKPALAYLDIIRQVRDRFEVPIAAYSVSGEYAMIRAAAKAGWIDERKVALETLTAIKRAGASVIITYHAVQAATWLSG